jgi:hypothetical protein
MFSSNALAIYAAIDANKGYYVNGWVPMGTIRDIAGIQAYGERSRNEEFCLALRELAENGVISLIPEENQKVITDAMLVSGAYVGGERKDYAAICD